METSALIDRLYRWGHFRGTGVKVADLEKLTISDDSVKAAIRSYQDFFADALDDAALVHHRRRAMVDGEPGPAFEQVFSAPRCGCPDFLAADEDGQILEANWPTSCRGRLKFGIAFRELPGLNEPETLGAFRDVCRNWNGALADVSITLRLDLTDRLTTDIWAEKMPLPGSTLAWSHLARNDCQVTLEQKYDTTHTWQRDYLLTTATHEVGHALGLPHNRDSTALMYPMINTAAVRRKGFPNGTDLNQCRSLGYTVAANPAPETDPPEPPPPDPPKPSPNPNNGQVQIHGTLTVRQGDTDLGQFLIVPKPRM